MNKVFCSTGALLGRPNNRDYRLLKGFSDRLNCDGFELMVYDTWYPEIDELIETIKGYKLNIPVVHCEKALSEKLAGARVWFENGQYPYEEMSPEEDKESVKKAIKEFKLNLRIAGELGADRMVFHLWNGMVSDKRIERNIERFGTLKDMAGEANIELLVENVICNTNDPLTNINLVKKAYPDTSYVYDTKMAEFHGQTMDLFNEKNDWMLKEGHIKHLHVNDYNGGVLDWGNFSVLPIGKGHVDFDSFFSKLKNYGYTGDYTVESTAFDKTGTVDTQMLNDCFAALRNLI